MTCYPLIKTEMFAKSAFGTQRPEVGLGLLSAMGEERTLWPVIINGK